MSTKLDVKAKKVPRTSRSCASLNAPVVHEKCRLEVKRNELGLTQPAMAKQCGISCASLWKYEKGVGIKLSTARRIAKKIVGKSTGDALDLLWPE